MGRRRGARRRARARPGRLRRRAGAAPRRARRAGRAHGARLRAALPARADVARRRRRVCGGGPRALRRVRRAHVAAPRRPRTRGAGARAAPRRGARRVAGVRARLRAVGGSAARVLVAHGLDDEARAVVRENGLVAREPHPRTPRTSALRVGVLGAVQPSKGVLELARLVAADARCELHVHGPRGAYHGDRAYVDALEALAARAPNVRLHGAYAPDELPAVLAGLDVVAVPSRWNEVYGLIAREARAAGLPVLASRVGGLVEAGVTLLAPDDAEAWRCALDALAPGRGAPPDARAPRSAAVAALADQLEADYLELAARCDRATTR
ncbi:MAG: glycosyltransferase [Planctomycetes bacterium]|nr:glycosyltransferase [Planctomycetota bacterium]